MSLLGCSVDKVRLERGRFSAVRGSKKSFSFAEVARHACAANGDLRVRKNYKVTVRSPIPAFIA